MPGGRRALPPLRRGADDSGLLTRSAVVRGLCTPPLGLGDPYDDDEYGESNGEPGVPGGPPAALGEGGCIGADAGTGRPNAMGTFDRFRDIAASTAADSRSPPLSSMSAWYSATRSYVSSCVTAPLSLPLKSTLRGMAAPPISAPVPSSIWGPNRDTSPVVSSGSSRRVNTALTKHVDVCAMCDV